MSHKTERTLQIHARVKKDFVDLYLQTRRENKQILLMPLYEALGKKYSKSTGHIRRIIKNYYPCK